jgi:hypothetical protein
MLLVPNQYLSVDHHVPLWAPPSLGALLRRNVQDQGMRMGVREGPTSDHTAGGLCAADG